MMKFIRDLPAEVNELIIILDKEIIEGKKNITSEICGNILKFIIHILINDDIINVQDKTKLISSIDNIINSCVVLVNLEKSLVKNIPSLFSRLFCWIFKSSK